MSDLHVRILARLDQIEAAAQAVPVKERVWAVNQATGQPGIRFALTDSHRRLLADNLPMTLAVHAALNDPASVLRWAAFVRKVMHSGLSDLSWLMRDLAEALGVPLDDL